MFKVRGRFVLMYYLHALLKFVIFNSIVENTQELKAPEFIKGIQDIEVMEGQSVKFRCKVKGYPQPRVVWYKDGHKLSSSINCKLG